MKKLLVLLVTVLFTSGVFAMKPATTKMETKPLTMKTHCYAMKDGVMVRCVGPKTEPMTKNAILKNGATVSTSGQVTMKDGKKIMLANGQCIVMSGKIGNFDKMHGKSNSK